MAILNVRKRARPVALAAGAALLVAGFAVAGASAATAVGDRPEASSETIGPFTGVAQGLVDRYRHRDDLESGPDRFYSDSKDVYRARFTYSFRIRNGIIEGRGTGAYLSATWHLEGQNEDKGQFSCDIPVATTEFGVNVSGRAAQGVLHLRFELVGARETNADYDCGAGFTGFATDSTYLAESLELVQAAQPRGEITASQGNPRIPPLRKLEEEGDERDKSVFLHEWTITIRAPAGSGSGSGSSGGGSGGGGGTASPSGPCTITGTQGDDVLVGTAGRDVICALGGDDVVRAGGGNDAIRAGAGDDLVRGGAGHDALDGGAGADRLLGENGNDLLLARDGFTDTVNGGGNRDRARIDRGRDRVQGVESVG